MYLAYLKVTNIGNQMVTPENIYQKTECEGGDCPIRDVLDRFGDKWSMLVLLVMNKYEKLRFNELQKQIGDISQKVLTATLRTMEADGLLKRTIYAEVPPRVEYEITAMGKSLVPHVNALSKWAKENMAAIIKSRQNFQP